MNTNSRQKVRLVDLFDDYGIDPVEALRGLGELIAIDVLMKFENQVVAGDFAGRDVIALAAAMKEDLLVEVAVAMAETDRLVSTSLDGHARAIAAARGWPS